MLFSSKVLIPLCAAGVLTSAGMAQPAQPAPQSQLTPRELFYSAAPEKDVSPKAKLKPKPKPKDGSKKEPDGVGSPKGNPDTTAPGGAALPGGGHIIKAADGPPLGVTYMLQRGVGERGNKKENVAADTVFHADDRIQIEVETNYPGYLYIGNRG
jgi:hypothetical protein